MPLKVLLKSLDEVDESLRGLYTKVGDEYVLDTDDGDFKSRIAEFRNNNIDLNKRLEALSNSAEELEKLKKQFAGLDPEQARKAIEKMQEMEDQKLIDAGKLDELLAQRTERMKSDYEGQISSYKENLEALQKERDMLKGKLQEVVIDNALQQAVTSVATVRKGAMEDVLARGRRRWRLNDDGNPVPIDDDGNVIYGKDPAKPMTMAEWAQSLVQDASYLFESNTGGGGQGNMGGSADGSIIDASNQDAINQNIEAIAAGKAKVVKQ